MVISATTGSFRFFRDGTQITDAEAIRMMALGGYRYADLSVNTEAAPGGRLMDDRWEEYTDEVGEALAETGIVPVQAHAYFISGGNHWTAEDYAYLYRANDRIIRVCARLGVPVLVAHPINGVNSDGLTFDEVVSQSADYFRHYQDTLAECGVKMAVENLIAHYTNDAESIAAVVDQLPQELFGNCWDAGHACVRGLNQHDSILHLGKRLIATHLHDNLGTQGKDLHKIPFSGVNDWEEIVHSLREIGYEGAFNFELGLSGYPRAMMQDNIAYCRRIAETLLTL